MKHKTCSKISFLCMLMVINILWQWWMHKVQYHTFSRNQRKRKSGIYCTSEPVFHVKRHLRLPI